MYTAEKCKDKSMMCNNIILTLGHIAVALRQEEKVKQLFTFDLLQRNPDLLQRYLDFYVNIPLKEVLVIRSCLKDRLAAIELPTF